MLSRESAKSLLKDYIEATEAPCGIQSLLDSIDFSFKHLHDWEKILTFALDFRNY